MKKIFFSISVLGITLATAFGLTSAFFSDTETSTGNTFSSGSIDLLINGLNDPVGIVDIEDLKPGDMYIVPKTLRVDTNDAYVWMHLTDIVSNQGTQTEPEDLEESQNGLKHDIENFLVYDLSIFRNGENEEILVSVDDNNLLPHMSSCWIPLGIIPGNTTINLNQSFHFDSAVTNWAQGDTLTFTEEFYAEQVRNNPNPTPPSTGSGRVWDTNLKRCIDTISCTEETVYLASSQGATQGLKKDGSAVDADRSIEANTYGAPEGLVAPPKWYSLGFGGTITLAFSNPVGNGAGDDLSIHEVTGGRPTYPLESALVEVSSDNATWHTLGTATSEPAGDGVTTFDFSDNPSVPATILYVRITDTTNSALHINSADGFDLDAISAVYGACTEL